MPITALPDDTVRLLGSPTVITTPVDLVKELLENAIDARATIVSVLVSPNTIDRIEVRDNGDGVHPGDYDALGRAGHTSKIGSFEELRTLGGSTLGFRGQALASANNLGIVTVTTRTAGDPTAVALKLLPGTGGVESQQRVSAPFGTAVSVSKLFNRMPVREQFAVREAQKYRAKMNQLLHSYALARPHIRLSFRVVGEDSKRSWAYSPGSGATVREAIVQVFGNEVMAHSMIKMVHSTANDHDGDTIQGGGKLAIEAVLPKPGAGQSKVSSKVPGGSFFSVDSRPISIQRGTMKKLQSMFRACYSERIGSTIEQKTSRDPFVRVNIKCSHGSYDPNIEPSKNVVLFAEESLLLDTFERLLSEVYSPGSSNPFVTVEKRQLLSPIQTRTPPLSSSGPDGEDPIPMVPTKGFRDHDHQVGQRPGQINPDPVREKLHGPLWSPNPDLDLDFQDVVQGPQPCRGYPSILSASPQQTVVAGPRIHYVATQIDRDQPAMLPTTAYQRSSLPVPNLQRRRAPVGVGKKCYIVSMSADPDMSSDEEAEMLASRFRIEQDAVSHAEEDDDTREGLNPWSIAKMTAPVRQQVVGQVSSTGDHEDPSQTHEPQFISGPKDVFDDDLPVLRRYGEQPGDLEPHRPARRGISPMITPPQQLSGFHHPKSHILSSFASPPEPKALPNLRLHENHVAGAAENDGLVQTRLAFEGQASGQNQHNNQTEVHIDDIPSKYNPPFRRPKKVNSRRKGALAVQLAGDTDNCLGDGLGNHHLTRNHIAQARQQSPPRPLKATSLSLGISNTSSPKQADRLPSQVSRDWVDEDPRKYLLRRQCSEAERGRKGRPPLKRAKTDMLPLEKVPEKEGVQHLALTVVPDTENLGKLSGAMIGVDTFCSDCRTGIDLCDNMNLEDVAEIEARLKMILCHWTEKVFGQRAEVVLDLRSQAKGKITAS